MKSIGRFGDEQRLRMLSRLFTRPVFASLARGALPEALVDDLGRGGLLKKSATQPLSDLFEGAWTLLRSGYRTEYVYKTEIANRLIFGRHSPNTASLHLEMPVGRSIADVVIVNGTSTAYEIKSEYDSPRRILSQTDDYLKVFDKVYVVTHPLTAASYLDVVDERVGVIALARRGSLSVLRDAASNKQSISPNMAFRCLRRAEYVSALENYFHQKIDYPNGIIESKCEEIFGKFTSLEAHDIFVNAVRSRTINFKWVSFVSQLPQSLRVLGYSTPLSERQRLNILGTLTQPTGWRLHF